MRTRWAVYQTEFRGTPIARAFQIPIYAHRSRAKAEAKANEFRTRAHKPFACEVRRETVSTTPGPSLAGDE